MAKGSERPAASGRSPAADVRRRPPRPLEDPWTLGEFVHNLQEGVYVTATDGQILDANPAFLRMLGVTSIRALRRFRAENLLTEPQRRREELEVLAEHGAVREFEFDIRRPDGEIRTVLDTAHQVIDPGTGEAVYHGILIDITDRKRLERQLLHAAVRDPLTGCYNRRFLREQEALLEHARDTWGVIVVDVDHFKAYNDRFGHHVGDGVLVRVARLLGSVVRPGDAVVRMGGDEFLLLFAGAEAAATANVARRLREGESGAAEVPVALSIGWAVREHGERLEQTIRRADRQMLRTRAAARHGRERRRADGDQRPQRHASTRGAEEPGS